LARFWKWSSTYSVHELVIKCPHSVTAGFHVQCVQQHNCGCSFSAVNIDPLHLHTFTYCAELMTLC